MTTQSITTLILGTAPENATPATHILAGPWCTAPASAEETGFDMPPEPLADPERLETAARQARQLVTQLAPRLRDYLNELYGTQHDDRYWDFVLAPWLVRAVETLIDRLYRSAGILETFGGRPLSVPVLDASEFAFADTQDFIMGGILNPQWNHWLFSRLLKRDWPAAWTAEELPSVRREAAPTRRENLLKHVARNILFSLPFPRVKGFSLRQSFDLSVVLTLNRDRRDDTIPLRLLGDPSAPPLPLGFTEDEAFDLAVALLPESLRKASIPQTLGHEQARIRSRVVSVAACEDDAYRIKMALHRGRGCRMIFIQHGGEYGDDFQVDEPDVGDVVVVFEQAEQCDGHEAFQHVEREDRQGGPPAQHAQHVGGAGVAASVFADVDAVIFLTDPHRIGNRSQQVGYKYHGDSTVICQDHR